MPAESQSDAAPSDYLALLGRRGDGPYDIALASLMLGALDHPGKNLGPYRAHLSELAEMARREAEHARNAGDAARALTQVIAGRYGYEGDRARFEDPANADMLNVIDKRRGLPVALGILYIHAARAAGLEACGLAAPGHFLLRIGHNSGQVVVDPFNGGAMADYESLAAPPMAGPGPFTESDSTAQSEPAPFEPVSDTDVLLRLQNNIRARTIKRGDIVRAVEIARRMTLIAPRRPGLWFELAQLQEQSGALTAARQAFEAALSVSRAGDSLYNEAVLALQALKRRLN